MTPEEIKAFAKEVYEQCIDKKMTVADFELFVHHIVMHKQLAVSALHRQLKKLTLLNYEDIA